VGSKRRRAAGQEVAILGQTLQITDFDNFWYEYSRHNLPSNNCSVSHLTQCMLLHYLEKADEAKYVLK